MARERKGHSFDIQPGPASDRVWRATLFDRRGRSINVIHGRRTDTPEDLRRMATTHWPGAREKGVRAKPRARRSTNLRQQAQRAFTHAQGKGLQAVGAYSQSLDTRSAAAKNADAADAYAVAADAFRELPWLSAREERQLKIAIGMQNRFRNAAAALQRAGSRDYTRDQHTGRGRRTNQYGRKSPSRTVHQTHRHAPRPAQPPRQRDHRRHRNPNAPTFEQQRFIAHKIRLLREEGRPAPQAAAIAYRMAGVKPLNMSQRRARGLRSPSRDVSPSGNSAVFYSGDLTVRLKLLDDSERYRAVIEKDGRKVWTGIVNAPRAGFGRRAYDSRYAYLKTAQAAVSFADHDHPGLADGAHHSQREGVAFRTYTATHRGGRGHR